MSEAVAGMSVEAFLDWEREQELCWEFDGFEPVAMNGGTIGHGTIQINVTSTLRGLLRGSACRVLGPAVKIRIGNKIRYPDALVTCTMLRRQAESAVDPVVLFEVLSNSTAQTDRVTKLREYRSIESLQRYVLLEQDEPLATVYHRTPSGWVVDQFSSGDTLEMPEIGVSVPLDELYLDVDFA